MTDDDILKAETLMSQDGVKFIPITEIKNIKFEPATEEVPEWAKIDITKPASIEVQIHAKKNGSLLEKSLYYQKSKKRRIRKKWSIEKILKIGGLKK